MDFYLVIKVIHIISSTVLFGTGLGIAFFMLRSRYSDNLNEMYFASYNTVLADAMFTLPAVIVQPLSGAWLVWKSGYQWSELWLVLSYIAYITAGLCWLPVVWIQSQLKKILSVALKSNTALPERYQQLFRIWFLLGWPAFISLLIIFFLMVFKPT